MGITSPRILQDAHPRICFPLETSFITTTFIRLKEVSKMIAVTKLDDVLLIFVLVVLL